MSLPRFFARQPVLVNMFVIAVVVAGLFALNRMPMEENPSVDLDMAIVVIAYPGASPEDVEKLITLPMEERIKTLPDIDFIHATSYEGRSTIFVQYEVGLEDYDMSVVDLKAEVDKAKLEIPDDAQDYVNVIKITTDEIWPVIGLSLGGDYSIDGLEEIAEALKEDMLDVPDVKSVDIFGIQEREVWVEADRGKLDAMGLGLLELMNAVQKANITLPAGRVEMGKEEFLVRPMGEVESSKDFADLPVRASTDGKAIRVSDVAKVKDTYKRDEVISRLDNKPSVYLRAFMKKDGSVVDIVDKLKVVVKRYQDTMPDISLAVRQDSSREVRDSIGVLSSNALTGLILVALLMWTMTGWRSAVLAVIGIPFSFLAAFIFLHAMDGTINTLSLFAFILVLGMLVDDAIIIIENTYRHLELGKTPLRAAIDGAEEVMWPVVSAVLTTIAAFLPLLMMTGIIGKFLAVLPIVVTLALIGSLIEALIVLPSHLADFGKLPETHGERFGDKLFAKLVGIYERQLNFFLNWRISATLATVLVTIVVIVMAGSLLRIEMFPQSPSVTERLLVRLPAGTKLEETDRVLETIAARIRKLPENEVESIQTLTGLYIENQEWIHTTDGGMVTMNMGNSDFRRGNEAIKADIRKMIADIPEIKTVKFSQSESGPPTGSPVELRIRGQSLEKMQMLAEMIADDLRSKKGMEDVMVSFRPGKKELRFYPDRVKLAAYGLTMTDISTAVRTAVDGWEATTFRDDEGDEITVRVLLREEDRESLNDLENIPLTSTLGLVIPLGELGEFTIQRGLERIERRDAKRSVTLTANVNMVDINSDEANRYVKEKYADFSTRYSGYSLEFGGEAEEQAESFHSLAMAFIVALILVYLILGTQFQSFIQPVVVMFTVPFSLLGVGVGLLVMNLTFSLVAAISVVALSGVVVNDSLVMVDFINKARAQGYERRKALLVAGSRRMRPILLTTVTTIAGLMPLAFGIGGDSVTWKPMAICMIWGLAFATFLTLFIIPSAYSLVDDMTNFVRRLFGMRSTDEMFVARAEELRDDTVLADLEENPKP